MSQTSSDILQVRVEALASLCSSLAAALSEAGFTGSQLNEIFSNHVRGECVQCGSTKNLHFDHDIPFSKGGSSLSATNVRLLCAKHNLEKSDKILVIAPWILVAPAAHDVFDKLVGGQLRF